MVRRGLAAALLAAACGRGDAPPPPASAEAPNPLAELWSRGVPAFGVFVPDERPSEGRPAPGVERPPPVYTAEGVAALARNPLYDYLFLNLEGAYDPEVVRTVVAGVAAAGVEGPPAVLVRIPPISADGEDAARERVREALAAGADGVVLPHVRNAEEARAAVGFFRDAGADVLTPDRPEGRTIAMLMLEDPDAVAAAREIAGIPGYSVLACGIGSLTRALSGDREAAEAGNQEVLAAATGAGLPDMITADPDDVARRVEEGFLALLMAGSRADETIRLGREAAGR